MYRIAFLRNSVIAGLIIIAGCAGKQKFATLPFYNTSDFTPQFVSSTNEMTQKITHTINPFSFTDQDGKTITDKDVEGKIHVANFIFTSCASICPTMTKHMKIVQKEFSHDPGVVMLSYSVTPWIDSVPRLKNYANKNEINSFNWHLLTGNKGEIYQLARQSYFAEEDLGFTKDSTEFLHTEHILLIDKTKRIRGIYNGTLQLEMEQLIKDIKALSKKRVYSFSANFSRT